MNMDTEAFYGVTLSEEEPHAVCGVSETEKMLDHKLIIKQICLGANAISGEFNIIQAEIKASDKEHCKIPIAVLKVGETRVLKPNLEFPSASVSFSLIQGTGPVHIHGQHIINEFDAEEWRNEEEECERIDYDEAPPHTNGKNVHRKK